MARKEFDSFDIKPFVRTLSYREFLTSSTSVLVIFAIVSIFQYLSGFIPFGYLFILLLIAMICNNIVYKAEHRRSNKFAGRLILDLMSIVTFLSIAIGTKYTDKLNSDETSILIIIPFLIVILLGIFESFVGLIKRLLIYIKWPIL